MEHHAGAFVQERNQPNPAYTNRQPKQHLRNCANYARERHGSNLVR